MATTAVPAPRVGERRWWEVMWEWVTTVDHKKIGIMYVGAAMVFFILGGLDALIIRLQLASAESTSDQPAVLQRAVHDARHHDGVFGDHAAQHRAG